MAYDIGARMRALRQMAGFRNVGKLAAELQNRDADRGLRPGVLHQIEQEKRVPTYRELREIAEACGMTIEWFTADFGRLDRISEDPRAVVAEKTGELAVRLGLDAGQVPDLGPDLQPADSDASRGRRAPGRSENDEEQAA